MIRSVKGAALATAAGVIILLQFTILSAALDFVTSFLLIVVGFVAGRFSK
ncbi:hypothetical protein [Rhizobium sp. Root651]|nr:hypothetical protein [Rhizobium sp. Root651]